MNYLKKHAIRSFLHESICIISDRARRISSGLLDHELRLQLPFTYWARVPLIYFMIIEWIVWIVPYGNFVGYKGNHIIVYMIKDDW